METGLINLCKLSQRGTFSEGTFTKHHDDTLRKKQRLVRIYAVCDNKPMVNVMIQDLVHFVLMCD